MTPVARHVALVGLLLLVTLLPAAVADGRLPDSAELTPSGLGRIHVGVSERRVERILGRGIRPNYFNGPTCGEARVAPNTFAMFNRGRLVRVSLNSARYATRSGLRVGMPQSSIRAEYGSRVKRSQHEYVPEGSYFSLTRGNRRFVFETDGSAITAIRAGRRPEVDYIEGCA